MFALGVTIYCYCFGKLPWLEKDSFKYELPDDAPAELKDIIKKLMKEKPDERPLTEELLEHPFFK